VGFVRFANGASLVLESSWDLNQPRAERMETWVFGTAGGMLQRNLRNLHQFKAELYRHDAAGSFQVTELRPGPDQARTSYDEFIDSVIDGRPSSAPPGQAVTSLRIIDALYESAASGREVVLA
jgi:predicted dehydrogenase